MAPLPAYNLTQRYYFDYVTGNNAATAQNHTAMWRIAMDSASTPDDVQTKFLQFLNARNATTFRLGWRVTGVRRSAANTDFSLPVPLLPALAAFQGTGSYAGWLLSSEAIQERYQGRSTLTGVRAAFSIYGTIVNAIGDFRLTAGESGNVANAVQTLNNALPPLLVAGDNTVVTWYAYANLNYNSYWEGELRV